jgi:hypothetical protein
MISRALLLSCGTNVSAGLESLPPIRQVRVPHMVGKGRLLIELAAHLTAVTSPMTRATSSACRRVPLLA